MRQWAVSATPAITCWQKPSMVSIRRRSSTKKVLGAGLKMQSEQHCGWGGSAIVDYCGRLATSRLLNVK